MSSLKQTWSEPFGGGSVQYQYIVVCVHQQRAVCDQARAQGLQVGGLGDEVFGEAQGAQEVPAQGGRVLQWRSYQVILQRFLRDQLISRGFLAWHFVQQCRNGHLHLEATSKRTFTNMMTRFHLHDQHHAVL